MGYWQETWELALLKITSYHFPNNIGTCNRVYLDDPGNWQIHMERHDPAIISVPRTKGFINHKQHFKLFFETYRSKQRWQTLIWSQALAPINTLAAVYITQLPFQTSLHRRTHIKHVTTSQCWCHQCMNDITQVSTIQERIHASWTKLFQALTVRWTFKLSQVQEHPQNVNLLFKGEWDPTTNNSQSNTDSLL